jgi:hypothetical protein
LFVRFHPSRALRSLSRAHTFNDWAEGFETKTREYGTLESVLSRSSGLDRVDSSHRQGGRNQLEFLDVREKIVTLLEAAL